MAVNAFGIVVTPHVSPTKNHGQPPAPSPPGCGYRQAFNPSPSARPRSAARPSGEGQRTPPTMPRPSGMPPARISIGGGRQCPSPASRLGQRQPAGRNHRQAFNPSPSARPSICRPARRGRPADAADHAPARISIGGGRQCPGPASRPGQRQPAGVRSSAGVQPLTVGAALDLPPGHSGKASGRRRPCPGHRACPGPDQHRGRSPASRPSVPARATPARRGAVVGRCSTPRRRRGPRSAARPSASKPRPSVPPGPLVVVAFKGCEAFTAARKIGDRFVSSASGHHAAGPGDGATAILITSAFAATAAVIISAGGLLCPLPALLFLAIGQRFRRLATHSAVKFKDGGAFFPCFAVGVISQSSGLGRRVRHFGKRQPAGFFILLCRYVNTRRKHRPPINQQGFSRRH